MHQNAFGCWDHWGSLQRSTKLPAELRGGEWSEKGGGREGNGKEEGGERRKGKDPQNV